MSEYWKPKVLSYSDVCASPFDDTIHKIYDDIRKQQEDALLKELLGKPKFEVRTITATDYIDSLMHLQQPVLNPRAIVKLNTKETNKMEAKKCDRCGKLYNQNTDRARVRFKFKEVYGAEDLKEEAIAKRQLEDAYIRSSLNGDVDMCPECKDSFKKWWESDDNVMYTTHT